MLIKVSNKTPVNTEQSQMKVVFKGVIRCAKNADVH